MKEVAVMKAKGIIKGTAFFLIFLFLFTVVTEIFRPKWTKTQMETVTIYDFYHSDKNNIENLFLGSSQVVTGTNNGYLYEKYGVSSFTLGGSFFTPEVNYYWLQMIYKRQKKIKTVVMDTSLICELDEPEMGFRKSYGDMPFGIIKLKALFAHFWGDFDELMSYIFDIILYHSRWNELERGDVIPDFEGNEIFNGSRVSQNLWQPTMPFDEFITDNDNVDEVDEKFGVNERQYGYAERIIEFCQAKNIKILLIKTPKDSWTKLGSQAAQKLADKYGVDFLDFSTRSGMETMGFDYRSDMGDHDHLNLRGARKLMDCVYDHLSKTVDYTDFRNVDGYEFKKLDLYRDVTENKDVKTCVNVDEYITLIKNPVFETVIASSDDVNLEKMNSFKKELSEIGLDFDWTELEGKNFVFHIKDGKCTEKIVDDDPIDYESTVGDRTFSLRVNKDSDVSPVMQLNKAEWEPAARGINFYTMNVKLDKYCTTFSVMNDGDSLIGMPIYNR